MQCGDCQLEDLPKKEDILTLAYFPSLKYCYLPFEHTLPTIVQDMVNNCKELRCAYFSYNAIPFQETEVNNYF